MIQKKFLCEDLKTAEETIPQISLILSETPHNTSLIFIMWIPRRRITLSTAQLIKKERGERKSTGKSFLRSAKKKHCGMSQDLIIFKERSPWMPFFAI